MASSWSTVATTRSSLLAGKVVYLAGILDLYSRKVAWWNTSDLLATELVTNAWKKAWEKHTAEIPGLLHHSDRGCQYASKEFRNLCWLNTMQELQ